MILLGVTNSVLFMGLMIFTNNAIGVGSGQSSYAWIIFASLLLASFIVSRIFHGYLVRITNQILFDFEISISNKIRYADYDVFKKIGQERVYTAIEDARVLGSFPELVIASINSGVVIVCGIAYLFMVTWVGALIVLGIIALFVAYYLVVNMSIMKELNAIRDLQNGYHRFLKDLLYGFREMKMSSVVNRMIYEKHIRENRFQFNIINTRVSLKYALNELIGSYGLYIVLGCVLFLFPLAFDVAPASIAIVVIVILFLMNPILAMISLIPAGSKISIAIERLDALEKEIDAEASTKRKTDDRKLPAHDFKTLSFDNVMYSYKTKDNEQGFEAGPFNIRVNAGEIVFLTGGNGSGKSTFVNLLTGIARPSKGTIYFNDYPLDNGNYQAFRDRLSVVFADHYLFSENYYDLDLREDNEQLQEIVGWMKLAGKLTHDTSRNTILHTLSAGQQKRLALIYALLQQNEILVLDEWAAEQDPSFKAYFYTEFLPLLKEKGKTLIAVTHDDTYFSQADRVLKFEFGKISDEVAVRL
jgi:cyclic peptide transporter